MKNQPAVDTGWHNKKMITSEKNMHTRYEIKPVKTSKDEIVHPALALESVIPKLNTSTIICGKSGSGKSVLLHALITEKRFYDKYRHFDKIFLVSPTGEQDDVQRSLGLP